MHKQKIHWFTLVELIVVITILAILGTIAFISLQWYSSQARDSTRISDLSSMKSSLELFNLDAWKYPIPTAWVDITYSGWTVWTQWTFWETVYANTDKLDKIPLDPITDKEYTYSITSKKTEFQLAWIIEWWDIAYNSNQANAWTTEATAYITWNYNWQMTKSLSWETCNVLAIPSIMTNNTSLTDLTQITSSWSFVYRWHKNLPSSFKWSKFKQDWWFDFTPNKILAYTDTWSCTVLSSNETEWITARVNLLKWLQDAYTWTTIKNEWEIKNILALNIDINNPSEEVKNYAGNLVNNIFGSKIIASLTPWNTWNNNITPAIIWSQSNPWLTCKDILDNWWNVWDWQYWLDTWSWPFQVTCDMTSDWWGWTLASDFHYWDAYTFTWYIDDTKLKWYISDNIFSLIVRDEIVTATRSYKRYIKNTNFKWSGAVIWDVWFWQAKTKWSDPWVWDDWWNNKNLTQTFISYHTASNDASCRASTDWKCNVVSAIHRTLEADDWNKYIWNWWTYYAYWNVYCGWLKITTEVMATWCSDTHWFSTFWPEWRTTPAYYNNMTWIQHIKKWIQ